MNIVEFFVEPLRLEFMVRAAATTLIASVVCATLSCWLVPTLAVAIPWLTELSRLIAHA